MKKLLFSLLFASFMLLASSNLFAQQYFVYDGKTFSVMLTCNSDNTEVTNVSFSFKGKWEEFKVLGVSDLESTSQGGFIYEVLDGKGNKYYVDYYRDNNKIIVTNEAGNGKWDLFKRKD
ncbi:MAG: hypothetical protein EAZ85_06105 [Bacteroidetes bacterium]|nr:MAG: hypothetical protein EAZ85_06105 [Bacteroidota bacterium]TAG89875.1 MAG: hypothetical protein EAZ20_05480 [Bacteroidota bacterium]